MNRYLRKNGKKVMAILGVLLMIAFALPSATSTFSRGDVTVGTLDHGKATLGSGEYRNARNQWAFLKQRIGPAALSASLAGVDRIDENLLVSLLGQPQVGEMIGQLSQIRQQNPMLYFQISRQRPELAMLADFASVGSNVFAQIDNNEDMFPLLVKEAQSMGVGVNDDLLKTILASRGIAEDAPEYAPMYQSLRALLLVNNAAARAAAVVKVSQPELQHLLATQRQQISVNLVEFPAKDFLAKVPAPTPDQLKAQFDKYKDKLAGEGQLDFGYKYPNRVKYDTILITRDEVKKGIPPIELDQLWEYYLRNKNSPDLTYDPSLSLAAPTGPAATNPTTRPMTFDEAKSKITTELTDQRATELANKVSAAVRDTLKADYDAFKAATGGAPSTTRPAPNASLGVPYNSKDYLSKLREKILNDHKVALTIEQRDRLQTPKDINDSDLGKASYATPEFRIPFPAFLAQLVDPFLDDERRKLAVNLRGERKPVELYEPTPAFQNFADNTLFARVTAADPSHVPPSLDEVKDKVTEDVKLAAAFDEAKKAAQATLDAAKSKWLLTVAADQKQRVITTGPFGAAEDPNRPPLPVTGYDLKGPALTAFVQGAFKLLGETPRQGEAPKPPATQPATTKPAGPTSAPAAVVTSFKDHPVGLIELPADAKVVVAEVEQLKPLWTKDQQTASDTLIANRSRVTTEQLLRAAWFNYNNLKTRTDYQPVQDRPSRNRQPNEPEQPQPNPNPFQ